MMRFARHIFVCQNLRPIGGRPSCGARGGGDIHAALLTAISQHPALCGSIAVTGCMCLGPCFDGPNLVIYPDGVWYAGVTPDDVADIVTSHLLAGEPVARLRYEWPPHDEDEPDDDAAGDHPARDDALRS